MMQKQAKLLAYHLELVNLLAACADGENRYIESMCQTIFTVEEVIHVLADDHIDNIRKAPYLK